MDSQDKFIKIPSLFKPCFENVPGMDNLKKAMANIYNVQQIAKKRFSFGVAAGMNPYKNNLLIVGPKGSGKTSAAGIVGLCYHKLGIITDRVPISTDYQSLLSTSATETVENVKKLVESAVDRIILIENVEEFDDNITYSPGFEMLDQIVDAYHRLDGAITIIATGNEVGVRELLRKKRNFAQLFDIPLVGMGEYTEEELTELAEKIAKGMGYILEPGVEKLLLDEYHNKRGCSDFNYLNLFKEMLVEASMNAATRVAKNRHPDELDVSLIKVEDFRFEKSPKNEMESLENLVYQLDSLIGLEGVKEQVRLMIANAKMAPLNKKAGVSTLKGTMHIVFSGEPGTGKTTVARIIGKIYAQLGMLSKGQIVECTRKDLVSDVVGGTAKLTHAKVEQALGGILFIDEAYSLCRDQYDTFGREAIDTLTADIYDYRDNLMVILAGYDKEMDNFLSLNPGMKSRIPNKIHFDNYSADELYRIFVKYIEDSGMLLHPDAEDIAKDLLISRAALPNFGNARGVENIFNEVVRNHQKHLASIDEEYISTNDIKIISKLDLMNSPNLVQKKEIIQEWYDELDSLTGLESVKEQIKQMVAKVRVNQIRKERGIPIQSIPSLHLVFKGNAGTGKTTVARIIGHIYKGLGVLTSGNMIECTRSDVVGEYQGQTAQKMKAKIQAAIGGVLFIDEVYSLCNGPYDSYGLEAINELVPAMENFRDNLMVIVAGYTEQMDAFMDINQGLKSRFSRELVFEDFNKEELIDIFNNMLASRSLSLEQGEEVQKLVDGMLLYCSNKRDFGNARGVRNLVEKLSQIQECRIAGLLENNRDISDEMLQIITEADINAFLEEME